MNHCRTLAKTCGNGANRFIQRTNKRSKTNDSIFTLSFPNHRLRSSAVEDKSRFSEDNDEVPEADRFIHKTEVERFMVESMLKVGTEEHRAKMLAANLSEADYRGHFSHGLNRLAMYVRDCQSNLCQPNNDPVILKKGPATAWVDGNNGLGVVVGTFCMEEAIKMAKETGIGWVAAKGSNHFGICQWYTEMAVKEGLIGISSTNTSPLVSPTRSATTIFGTNPISVAAPGARGDDRFILDMSTSAVAIGKVEIQMRKNEPLPSAGWALGKDGKPTCDPKEAFYDSKGLLPLGGEEMNSGYKGYALGMFVELITSIMSGGAVAHNVRSWTTYDKEANLGQCFAAINPDMFCPNLPERLQELMDHLRKLEPVDSTKPILVPGDPERMSQSFVEEKQNGAILYTSNHIHTYKKLADDLKIQPMQPLKFIQPSGTD